jgi:hypothetical protein
MGSTGTCHGRWARWRQRWKSWRRSRTRSSASARQRRQELGLQVNLAGKMLPLRASRPKLESPDALATLDAEPPQTERA